LLDGSNYES
jgi:hypothetical protein